MTALGYEPVQAQGENLIRGTSKELTTVKNNLYFGAYIAISIPAKPNTTYTFSAYFSNVNKKAGSLRAYVNITKTDNTYTEFSSMEPVESEKSGYSKIIFTTPDDAKSIRCDIRSQVEVRDLNTYDIVYKEAILVEGAVANPVWMPSPYDYLKDIEARLTAIEKKLNT